MNQFIKTYLRARRIVNWKYGKEYEFNLPILTDLDRVIINPYSIQHIKNPSEPVQLVAVKKDSDLIQHIENPYPSVNKLYKELTKKI
jgi:hypothetical protein